MCCFHDGVGGVEICYDGLARGFFCWYWSYLFLSSLLFLFLFNPGRNRKPEKFHSTRSSRRRRRRRKRKRSKLTNTRPKIRRGLHFDRQIPIDFANDFYCVADGEMRVLVGVELVLFSFARRCINFSFRLQNTSGRLVRYAAFRCRWR